jgi:hypothetical protein
MRQFETWLSGSGVESAKTLAAHGIKYVFIKNPANKTLVQAIDGLGGFIRNSQTSAGIVWRVAGISDHLTFEATGAGIKSIASTGDRRRGRYSISWNALPCREF